MAYPAPPGLPWKILDTEDGYLAIEKKQMRKNCIKKFLMEENSYCIYKAIDTALLSSRFFFDGVMHLVLRRR